MKKSMILSLIAVFVLSISSLVLAEDLTGKTTVGLDLSYFSCEGWENDEWDQNGFMADIVARYFLTENIALGASIGYWSSKDEEEVDMGFFGTASYSMTLTLMPILVTAEYFFAPADAKVRPFAGVGLGMANATIEEEVEIFGITASAEESASPFCCRLGGGVEYKVNPTISITGNLKYQILNIDFGVDTLFGGEECDANGLIIGAGVNMLF